VFTTTSIRRLLWFGALYILGVAAVALVALVLKAMLPTPLP
jgi:predicted RND superfamily exporter protein